MTQNDVERKQLVLIEYLQDIINEYTKGQVDEYRKPIKWKVKAEYSTNDNDKRIVTVQEQSGLKTVFYGNCTPINNYYMIDIYGLSIKYFCKISNNNIPSMDKGSFNFYYSFCFYRLFSSGLYIRKRKLFIRGSAYICSKFYINFYSI